MLGAFMSLIVALASPAESSSERNVEAQIAKLAQAWVAGECTGVAACRRRCLDGVVSGCTRFGLELLAAGGASNEREAVRVLEEACGKGEPTACDMMARRYQEGEGVTGRDYKLAAERYTRGCRVGFAPACEGLGVLYARGWGVEVSDSRAIQLWRFACAHEDSQACMNLAGRYELGRGVPIDHPKAVALYEFACTKGSGAGCNNAGSVHLAGRGVAKNAGRAFALFEKGCSLEEAVACENVGVVHFFGQGKPVDKARAIVLFKKACAMGSSSACRRLGVIFEEGDGVDANPAEALDARVRGVELDEKRCKTADDRDACFQLGRSFLLGGGVPRNAEIAFGLFRTACAAGLGAGCHALGDRYRDGSGTTRDAARALSVYDDACRYGSAAGCNELGLMLESQPGRETTALDAFERGCRLGDAAVCNNRQRLRASRTGVTKGNAASKVSATRR